ncbi:MAG: hypothetical protein KF787_12500 [Phycisphaeraceae bacterium]|nr:hypothetical protein [Phycisphaerae bacterium]MBX3393456.1 hypothetical protein [Phycisphaeraceae bacterium]
MTRRYDQEPTTATGNDRSTTRRAVFSTALTAAIVAGVGFGLARGIAPLESEAVRIIGARPAHVEVRWPTIGASKEPDRSSWSIGPGLFSLTSATLEDTPTWLPEQLREEIQGLAQQHLNTRESPFSADPLRRIGQAMERSGWFDSRPVVRREHGGRLVVSGTWRIPAAVVRSGGRDHLVSWDGKPMPVVYDVGASRLTPIVGASASPPKEGSIIDYAKSWPGEDVHAALELLNLIRSRSWFAQVAAIDVSAYASDRTLCLVTTGGGRVNWGGRPSKPRLGEASTAAKLTTIDRLQKGYRSIDAGGRTIDIYWLGRPLEIDLSATAQRQEQRADRAAGAATPGSTPRR